MILKDIIKSKIKKCIDSTEVTRFVIYPFGNNGLIVRDVLKDYFGIDNPILVDGIYCRYNKDIISPEKLKKIFDESMMIIIAVENCALYQEIKETVLEFTDDSHIINIFKKDNPRWQSYNAFELGSFLPEDYTPKKKDNGKKIKVRIYNFTNNCWNTMMSIAWAFKEDKNVDLLIINRTELYKTDVFYDLDNKGFSQIDLKDYSAKEDKPDIFLVCHLFDTITEIGQLHRYCKLVISANAALVRYFHTWEAYWQMAEKSFAKYGVDYFLYDSLLFNDIVCAGYYNDNIIEMGNAKYDSIYEAAKKNEVPDDWKKLLGLKKVFAFTTDHGVHDYKITEDITFDLYTKFLFDYAHNNPDVGFIFRPHPTLIYELQNVGIWNDEKIEELKDYCNSTPNIVFDTTMNYNNALIASDAIITDGYSGVTIEALPLMKPICMLFRNKSDRPYHIELSKCNYRANSKTELLNFINMVINGADEKRNIRENLLPHIVKHFDGKNGMRIKEFALEKYNERI